MDIDLVSASEAASKLRISVQAVHRLAVRGSIPYLRLSGRRFFRVAALDAYMADSEAQKRRRPASELRRGQLKLTLGEALQELRSGKSGLSGGVR